MSTKKNNYSYIGISFIILVFGILFVPKIINRITNNEITDKDRHQLLRNGNRDASQLVTIGKAPNFNLINQDSIAFTSNQLIGKVYVVEFFFTTCPSICPIMNENMKKVNEAFKNNNNFEIVSITINPNYDTPIVLKEYAKKYNTNTNWNFLTGDFQEISLLANKGFNLYVGKAPEIEGGFEHSGFFALIDQEGNIKSRTDANNNPIIYYDGLEEEGIKMLIEDIKLLIN